MGKGIRDTIKMKYTTFKIFSLFFFFYIFTLKEITFFLSGIVAVKLIRLRSLFTHLELI